MNKRLLLSVLIFLTLSSTTVFAQPSQRFEFSFIGSGHALAGTASEMKLEILNGGPGDVKLERGEIYLDADLTNDWRLIYSESLGDFHLDYLQSAIWTFKLPMPSSVQASNVTSGTPQVDLVVQIVFRDARNLPLTSNDHLSLGVPGAILKQAGNSGWIIFVTTTLIVIAVCILLLKRKKYLVKAESVKSRRTDRMSRKRRL